MHKIFSVCVRFVSGRQRELALAAGYLAVAALGVGIGRLTFRPAPPPEVRVETAFLPPNDNPYPAPDQSKSPPKTAVPAPASGDCPPGQIKGNVGSGGSKVYHMPGGSFYNRTKAEQCFATEDQAQAAGFRKSSA